MPDLNELMAGLLSGDEERAEAAVHGLIELGEPAIAPLLEAARSEDPDQRWWAVRAMGESPATRADTLLPFLQDDSGEVRQNVFPVGAEAGTQVGSRFLVHAASRTVSNVSSRRKAVSPKRIEGPARVEKRSTG